jgi:tetratricopeptide (TPR) repeat protein
MRAFVLPLVLGIAVASARADNVSLAREHYQKGTTLYELSKFGEAAAEYEEAYKAKPDPALLFNIGQAYRLAGKPEAALRSYRSYLHKLPDASNRVEVEAHIERLQKAIDEQAKAAAPPPPPAVVPAPSVAPSGPASATAMGQPTLVAHAPREPIYRRWWLWTAVGGAVAVGLTVGLVVGLVPNNASGPINTVGVSLH